MVKYCVCLDMLGNVFRQLLIDRDKPLRFKRRFSLRHPVRNINEVVQLTKPKTATTEVVEPEQPKKRGLFGSNKSKSTIEYVKNMAFFFVYFLFFLKQTEMQNS